MEGINSSNISAEILHIRPRFRLETHHTKSDIEARIKKEVAEEEDRIKPTIVQDHITLDIIKDIHYWTPQMSFRIEEDEEEEGSIIYGIIGPKPAVWTLFMFIYFSVGVLGFILSSIGVARWMLGEYSNWLLAFPLAILFMLTAYRTGKYGEKLAHDQTEILKDVVRKVLKD